MKTKSNLANQKPKWKEKKILFITLIKPNSSNCIKVGPNAIREKSHQDKECNGLPHEKTRTRYWSERICYQHAKKMSTFMPNDLCLYTYVLSLLHIFQVIHCLKEFYLIH